MDNDSWDDQRQDSAPSTAQAGAASGRAPYVRQRPARRTAEAIDDLTQDELPSASYTHDSNISVRGGALSGGGSYRRSRSDMSKFQENNRYGQYLEIPKGQRSIFASRELARRRRSALALVLVVALLVGVAVLVWRLMERLGV